MYVCIMYVCMYVYMYVRIFKSAFKRLTAFTRAQKATYSPQIVVQGNLKQLFCSSAKYYKDMSEWRCSSTRS